MEHGNVTCGCGVQLRWNQEASYNISPQLLPPQKLGVVPSLLGSQESTHIYMQSSSCLFASLLSYFKSK